MLRFRHLIPFTFIIACGGSGDDLLDDSGTPATDATTDQGKADSPSNDSPSADSPSADAPDDSPSDGGIVLDTGLDAPIKDGGINGCLSNNDCNGNTFYCEKGTGNCSGSGQCMQKPQFCPQIYKPVCGCDKQTHSNDCYAHAAGTSVMYNGACE